MVCQIKLESAGHLDKLFKRLAKAGLLVIDDFLLTATTEYEQKYLMEVFEIRSREKVLILSSQMTTSEWHKKMGGGAVINRAHPMPIELLLKVNLYANKVAQTRPIQVVQQNAISLAQAIAFLWSIVNIICN